MTDVLTTCVEAIFRVKCQCRGQVGTNDIAFSEVSLKFLGEKKLQNDG